MSYGCRPLAIDHLSGLGLFVIPTQLRGLLSKPVTSAATVMTISAKKPVVEPEYTVKVQRLYAKRKPNTKVSWGGYGCVQKISGIHDAVTTENKNDTQTNKGKNAAEPSGPKHKIPLSRKTLDPRTGSVIEVIPNEHFEDRAAFWKAWRSNLKDMSAYLAQYEQFGPEVDNISLAIFDLKRYEDHGKV
ncbi:unnamed protein product [Amoebophrya sp. A25]|nr:unnamed protein product [Amoebophrya sp. A25]|eukprot:GSA25T00014121001.1